MIWIISFFTLFLCGCQQSSQETHYAEVVTEAPAEAAPAAANAQTSADPHAGMDMSSMGMGGLENSVAKDTAYSWVVPQGWKEEPGKGMRLASFHLVSDEKAIDASIVSLAGAAGGLEPNLRRWMGQIGIQSSSTELTGLINAATTLKIKGGAEGKVFDFTTIQPQAKDIDKSMVVVMLSMNDATVFVKMTGTLETVKKNKEDFFKFAQSIEPKKDSSALASLPASLSMKDPHAGMDMASMGNLVESAAPATDLTWSVPEGWKEEPAGHMRLATFHLMSDPKLIDCSIISLGGPAGGLDANLERWAGQLGLGSSAEALEKFKSTAETVNTKDGKAIKVYDFSLIQTDAKGTDKSMIAAMVPMDQSTVFVKMTGSLEVIKQNKASFLKLLSSITHK